jgi:uncharacterized protein (TIGR02284 family)
MLMQADAQALAPIASILTDQVRLYARAAEISDAHAPADAIRSVWNERQALLQEFQGKLHALGVTDESHGTLLGAGHKAFLEARAAVSDDTKAAIEEVERGEDYLRDEIEKRTRDDDLSAEIRSFLSGVLPRIKPGHDRIAQIKRALH